MTKLLEWLFDLERIRLGEDAPLLLRWGNPLEAWVLFCVGLAAAAWIALAYRQEPTSAPRRAGLAVLRCAVVGLVVAVLCQPVLVLQRNRVEPSHVALAVDTSQSMAWRDVYEDVDLARSVRAGAGLDPDDSEVAASSDQLPSRLELVRLALLRDDAAPLRRLLQRNGLQLISFDGSVESHGLYPRGGSAVAELGDALGSLVAKGTTTDIGGAIREIIEKSEGRRLAAIVLASDGQATHAGNLKDMLDLAAGRQVPIVPLRIGSPQRPRDVEVTLVKVPETVFVNDLLVVQAELSASGLTDAAEVEVRLVHTATDEVVARERVALEPDGPAGALRHDTFVSLRYKPTQTGLARFRIEVPPLKDEWITENNEDEVEVAVVEDRLRVLYVEGYPRYEYRYVKNALLREQTVDLSVLLLRADERFVQEGTTPIRRFPESAEELNRFDVVVFGDVDPEGGWIADAQLELLVDFVGVRGGGFGLIAGEYAAPHRFVDTPLEKLIPVQIDSTFSGRYEGTLDAGFSLQLTPEGRRSGLFQVAAGQGENGSKLFHRLPKLYWAARTLGPKPGASSLAEHPSRQAFGGLYGSRSLMLPIVVTGRYGAGKLFFQGTDDTWRWRRRTGEFLHDAYWVQVVRAL
ncbi:MAG TPA: hypothetical protein VLS27_19035, partial [Gammaproteobacteria bacterium]|nr:hypothetical protein [Gammaproteobacteria bacterium]